MESLSSLLRYSIKKDRTKRPCWCKLRPLDGEECMEVAFERIRIGTSNGCPYNHMIKLSFLLECELVVENSAQVSDVHCFISRDPSGNIWLCDTSGLGTTVLGRISLHGDVVELHHGDTFLLSSPKDVSIESVDNIGPGFHFELLQVNDYDKDLENELTCPICSCIFYQCCSLNPCLHTLCMSCWAKWQAVNPNCPICRNHVTDASKNHHLTSLVDLFIRRHPEKSRSDSEKLKLDETVRRYEMANVNQRTYTSYSSDTSDSGPNSPRLGPSGACVVCTWNPSTPSTSDQCQQHSLCGCCCCHLPRYNPESMAANDVECENCGRSFCSLVNLGRCRGCVEPCLLRLNDLRQLSTLPDIFLLGNRVESSILLDHIRDSGIPVNQFISECLSHFSPSLFNGRITSLSSVVCRPCANSCFSLLAYRWRQDVSVDRLPVRVSDRPNCNYGHQCRTQTHNLAHAYRYNHICEPSRYDGSG